MSIRLRVLALATTIASVATTLSAQGTVDKFGFVSRRGEVIAAVYATTGEFSDGMAKVSMERNGPYGYIDKTGKMVIPERYKTVSPFRNGVAYVIDKDDKSLIIDKRGKTVRELKDMYPSLPEAPGYTGLIRFFGNGKYGYMTEKGDVVIQPATYEEADFFYEGLAAVKLGGKIGFIDTTGKMVIPPQFYTSEYLGAQLGNPPQFHNGLAPVALDSAATLKGYVNKTGTMVIKPIFTKAGYFISGVAPVVTEASKGMYGYIDTTGTKVIDYKYLDAWDFSEGTGKVEYMDSSRVSQWSGPKKTTALIDNKGAIVLKITDSRLGAPMSEGVVDFKTSDDLLGFMDVDGDVVVAPQFKSLWQMQDGMAKMRMEVKRVSNLAFSGTHYIWYDISAGTAQLNGGTSYYVHYAHVYGAKGLTASEIAGAVSAKMGFPIMTYSKGSGSFEYNSEQIKKDNSSAVDEALKRVGVMRAGHRVGSYGVVDKDLIWPENIGTFSANK